MNALALRSPIKDTLDQVFEPIEFTTLADLFSGYREDLGKMETISRLFDGRNAELITHFVEGNLSDGTYVPTDHLFQLEPAVGALNASYWQRALELTDVLEAMPQKRRDEWREYIKDHDTPAFDEDVVIATLQDLMAQRHRFFAERVDGVFQSLSHEHVTNRPEGFYKRMIIAYVYNGYPDYSRCGTISDLRGVVARFMGREPPEYRLTSYAVEQARREHCGQWVTLDGGALRIRLYKKGTAHLEVHPEIAWRLNSVLASIYPSAIPDKHRTHSKRSAPKDVVLYSRPLPAPVLSMLAGGRKDPREFTFPYGEDKGATMQEAIQVLVSLGGVPAAHSISFDYDYRHVLSGVITSGVIPDQKAHQYYPTPPDIAEQVLAAARIGPQDTVLEPSAGQGNIAALVGKGSTLVEVSPLHCEILRSKGFRDVVCADFLRWAPGRRFDRVVMNPPYTKGQWLRHVEHAADLVASGGRLVAVLPSSAPKRKDLLPGWCLSFSGPVPFPGTSIEVVVLTAERS